MEENQKAKWKTAEWDNCRGKWNYFTFKVFTWLQNNQTEDQQKTMKKNWPHFKTNRRDDLEITNRSNHNWQKETSNM